MLVFDFEDVELNNKKEKYKTKSKKNLQNQTKPSEEAATTSEKLTHEDFKRDILDISGSPPSRKKKYCNSEDYLNYKSKSKQIQSQPNVSHNALDNKKNHQIMAETVYGFKIGMSEKNFNLGKKIDGINNKSIQKLKETSDKAIVGFKLQN